MSHPTTEHLTLRLTPAQKGLITHAASQAGVTLTEFVTAAAEAQAHRALNGETMHLNAEQSRRVAEALLNPGEPNAALRGLFARPGRPEAAMLPAELTIHQAADVLNVTRSHVKSLLAQGQIDHQGEGARPRIDRAARLQNAQRPGTPGGPRRANARSPGTRPRLLSRSPTAFPAANHACYTASESWGNLLSRPGP